MVVDAVRVVAPVVPYLAQGHVISFMELADCLLDCGFAVTFVNTDFNFNHHSTVAAADGRLRLVSVAETLTRWMTMPQRLHAGVHAAASRRTTRR